jgi:hypothetical protein
VLAVPREERQLVPVAREELGILQDCSVGLALVVLEARPAVLVLLEVFLVDLVVRRLRLPRVVLRQQLVRRLLLRRRPRLLLVLLWVYRSRSVYGSQDWRTNRALQRQLVLQRLRLLVLL